MKNSIQIKICGIKNIQDAEFVCNSGASAMGLVFFEKSIRNVEMQMAKEICKYYKDKISIVGVFVDSSINNIVETAKITGMSTVQLHGCEMPESIEAIQKYGIKVIKTLFNNKYPSFNDIVKYKADAYLAESSGIKMPGGNGKIWNWSEAGELGSYAPMIVAGGLNCENIRDAVLMSKADGVDVSSGVESSPGVKDREKIFRFIQQVKDIKPDWNIRSVFK